MCYIVEKLHNGPSLLPKLATASAKFDVASAVEITSFLAVIIPPIDMLEGLRPNIVSLAHSFNFWSLFTSSSIGLCSIVRSLVCTNPWTHS